MEEEVDLRQYILILIKYWYWIVGAVIIAILAAFLLTPAPQIQYQASALVTTTLPAYELQFDSRFRNTATVLVERQLDDQYATYPTLATSDSILLSVAEQTGWSLAQLRGAVRVDGSDGSGLLVLTVAGDEENEVVPVVNVWAGVFVETANQLFAGGNIIDELKQQQEMSAQALTAAEKAIVEFRETSGFGFIADSNRGNRMPGLFIEQQLETKNNQLVEEEVRLSRLYQLRQEMESLRETATAETSSVLMAGLLSDIINTGVGGGSQIYEMSLPDLDPLTDLETMGQILSARISALEAEIESLQTEVDALQIAVADQQKQLNQLIRDRDILAETYTIVANKLQEAQLQAEFEDKTKIASQAQVSKAVSQSRQPLNMAIAGMLGLIVGTGGVFAVEWWRNAEALRPKQPEREIPLS